MLNCDQEFRHTYVGVMFFNSGGGGAGAFISLTALN